MKLHERKNSFGFSLSETLITVLLMTIILSSVGGGIVALKNAYEKIVMKSDALTLIATISESMEADLASASSVSVKYTDDTKTVVEKDELNNELISFNSGKRNYNMSFVNNDGAICISTPKLSEPFSVTTKGEHTSKLNSKMTDMHYEDPDPSADSDEYFTFRIVIETNESTPKEVLNQLYVVKRYE